MRTRLSRTSAGNRRASRGDRITRGQLRLASFRFAAIDRNNAIVSDEFDRYRRQIALPMIGADGQARLRAGHVLVVGCGALGSVIVDQLARAGVGTLTIIDRDVVERSNLQRQTLFDEFDAEHATPKAEAAKSRVARINSDVRVRAFYDDLGPRNAER